MSKEQDETREPFADLEKIKINILKRKILNGLDEFRKNKGQQWTELRFEEPLLVKLLSSIEQSERVGELETIIETSTYIQRMLRKQKRCYREALEEIKRDIQGDYTENELVNDPLLEVIIEQIDKVLEGEE